MMEKLTPCRCTKMYTVMLTYGTLYAVWLVGLLVDFAIRATITVDRRTFYV